MSEHPDRPSTVAALPGASRATLRRQLIGLFLILVPVAVLIAWRIPITYPEGDFVMNVLDVAKTGHVSSTFTPDTYPYVAGLAYKVGGTRGFLLVQAIIYLLVASSVLWLVRSLTGGARAAIAASLIISLDPDLLSTIPRVWDTGLTCLLLLAFTCLCLAASRRASLGVLLAMASLWGFSVSVRPNFLLLILPVGYLLIAARDRFAIPKFLGTAALAFAVFALMNVLSHGSFYVAQNGPYNIYAGANAYTLVSLEEQLNAEGSVVPALADLGIHTTVPYDLALRPLYTRESAHFIEHRPLKWLYLGGAKLFTLLRPDTKVHGLMTVPGLVKALTSLCFPLWLVTMMLVRKLEKADLLVMMIAAAYILPFLLSNADPRFRPALDLLVLSHTASLIVRRLGERSRQQGTGPRVVAAPPSPAAA